MENVICNNCGNVIDEDNLIDYSDIPEVTDFTGWRRRPEFAEGRKNGYTIIIEREGYNEVRKYDFSKIPKPLNGGSDIPYEVTIEKREKHTKAIDNCQRDLELPKILADEIDEKAIAL
jgi:TPP-dependent 2-oxoacid decarboxylase